jgi:hypothetical protein
MEENITHIALFRGKRIRRKLVKDKWFFSVIDIVEALTDSADANDYWYRLKKRELESSEIELSTFCRQLKLKSGDGKEYETDCADTEGIFRIIQSIPSKKAEPFKRWLAKVGYERVQEIENPELAQERMKQLYELKGYPKDWIDKRLRGIAIRQNLTDEWKNRGIQEKIEFAILTNEIAKATFGVSIEEHKKIKEINKENLRDHMTDLELIFSMLGEASTTEITREKDIKGFAPNLIAAKLGGEVAGKARKDLERKTGKKIVTKKRPIDNQDQTEENQEETVEGIIA